MKLEVRWKSTQKSQALRNHVLRRSRFAFRPSAGRLRRVVVRLEDLNGPKGGVDKRCTVEVSGSFGTRITEARDVDLFVAVDRALEMAGRAVVRARSRRASWDPETIRTAASY